jgi:hypothetical protein
MKSRWQGGSDAGVQIVNRGADDDANEDSVLIYNWNNTFLTIRVLQITQMRNQKATANNAARLMKIQESSV